MNTTTNTAPASDTDVRIEFSPIRFEDGPNKGQVNVEETTKRAENLIKKLADGEQNFDSSIEKVRQQMLIEAIYEVDGEENRRLSHWTQAMLGSRGVALLKVSPSAANQKKIGDALARCMHKDPAILYLPKGQKGGFHVRAEYKPEVLKNLVEQEKKAAERAAERAKAALKAATEAAEAAKVVAETVDQNA